MTGGKIVKVRNWNELPRVLKPGIIYEVNDLKLRPRIPLDRRLAKEIALGVEEIIGKE